MTHVIDERHNIDEFLKALKSSKNLSTEAQETNNRLVARAVSLFNSLSLLVEEVNNLGGIVYSTKPPRFYFRSMTQKAFILPPKAPSRHIYLMYAPPPPSLFWHELNETYTSARPIPPR